jgi:hypothetical protein
MGTRIEDSRTVSGYSVLQRNTTRGTEGIPYKCDFFDGEPKDCSYDMDEQPKQFHFHCKCFPNFCPLCASKAKMTFSCPMESCD